MSVGNAIDREIEGQAARLKALKKIKAVLAGLSDADALAVIDGLRSATDEEGPGVPA